MELDRYKIFTTIKNNKYLFIFLLFLIWMLFLDTNSWIKHRERNKTIEKLENRKEFYESEISNDRKALDELKNNPEKLEKYARERFLMKKKDEDIFIIKKEE